MLILQMRSPAQLGFPLSIRLKEKEFGIIFAVFI